MRRLYPAIALLSLLLCVANVALWVRSYSHVYSPGLSYVSWPERDIYLSRFAGVRLVQGRWLLQWGSNQFNLAKPEGIVQGWGPAEAEAHRRENPSGFSGDYASFPIQPTGMRTFVINGETFTAGPANYWVGMDGMFDHTHDRQSDPSRTDVHNAAMFPAWVTVLLLTLTPIAYGRRWLIRSRRVRRVRCAECNYDLRASPERCPECGAVPPNSGKRPPVSTESADREAVAASPDGGIR